MDNRISFANVLRAALQVVKTATGTEIVSAFMLMDTQAKDMGENGCFVFADCGLNQNPNPEQLAAIASSSAKTFEQLIGATPRVAMLSINMKADTISVPGAVLTT